MGAMSDELRELLEIVCAENFVLKTMLQGHRLNWKQDLENNLHSPAVQSLVRGKIGDNVLESLAQLRTQLDQYIENRRPTF